MRLAIATVVALSGGIGTADLINVTEVEQQVGLDIGYRTHGDDRIVVAESDPCTPRGYGDADLGVSADQYGASGKAALGSRFEPNRFTVRGSVTVSAAWQSPPQDADETNVTAASIFLVRFDSGASPASLNIEGSIGIALVDDRRLRAEQTSTSVRLIAGSGTLVWEEELNGTGRETLKAGSHRQTLVPHQEYRLAIYGEAGTLSDPEHDELKSRAAWFDLSATVTALPVSEAQELSATLAVVTPELEILEVDGQESRPLYVDERVGFREYSVPAGEHTVTAWFRCATAVPGGLVGEMQGIPLARQYFFTTGRKYLALYGIHPDAMREPEGWIEGMVADIFLASNSYWAMEIVDLDDIRSRFARADRDGPAASEQQRQPQSSGDAADVAGRVAVDYDDRFNLASEVIGPLLERLSAREAGAATEQSEVQSIDPASPASPQQ